MALADAPVALIEAARRGQMPAVEALLRRISHDLYRIIFSMLRDHDEADEVLQETLVRMFRYIHKLKDSARFASWAMRIAVNQVHTWRMKQSRTRLYEWIEGYEPEEGVVVLNHSRREDPREAASRRETMAEIRRAMAELPDRQQTAIVLFELEGLSIKEIAEVMECSEGAVKFNIHEARKKLQRRLTHLAGVFGLGREEERNLAADAGRS